MIDLCPNCGTAFLFDHAIYKGLRGGSVTRRWCPKCKLRQVGRVCHWRSERYKEFKHDPGLCT